MATIAAICKRDVIVAPTSMSVTDAAKLMRRHHVGTVVVIEPAAGGPRRPLGVVTDRDIVVEVVARDMHTGTLTLGDIMLRQPITVNEDDSVFDAIQVMRYRGVRRLPVVGSEGQLIGIVATDDLLEALVEQLAGLSKVGTRRQQYEAAHRR